MQSILNNKQIQQKIIRIAHQIAEYNYNEPEIILVGIAKGGFTVASAISKELSKVIDIKQSLHQLEMDKTNPVKGAISINIVMEQMDGKSVVLIDDVLESGRTLTYAAKFILNQPVKKLATAVLVDRMHPKFPIHADFVGLTLSTTLQNHIELKEENDELTIFLH